MRYRYYFCDVFSNRLFGGNQLAVLPHAQGLSAALMQKIAREFNFSETAFVFPAEAGNTRKVRIFTPGREVPFAGHPNVGTAFVLAKTGELGAINEAIEVVFEEQAGLVPIRIEPRSDGGFWCELAAPQLLTVGAAVSVELVARAASLSVSDIRTDTHPPQTSSVGLPFLIAELADRAALERAFASSDGFRRLLAAGVDPAYLHLYVRTPDSSTSGGFDLRARMFSPLDGIPEDPATGSANCALAALLTHHASATEGEFSWRIAQGGEIGRPSVLDARTHKRAGSVDRVWIGGESVMVAEGFIDLGSAQGEEAP